MTFSYYKTVALTFDDGPTRTNSTKVLNSLMEVGAPATFFMIGKNMKPYADLVQRAHDEGHAVASHNWTHGDARKISAATLRAMPEKVNNALISIIGIPTKRHGSCKRKERKFLSWHSAWSAGL